MTNLLVLVLTWAYMSRPLSLCTHVFYILSQLMVVSALHEQSREIFKDVK